MKTFQEIMDEVKVESYKDCVWYLDHVDKCKLCDAHGVRLPCHCKEEMGEFCTWITKFLKSSLSKEKINEKDESISEPYLSLNKSDEVEKEQNPLFQTIIEALK